jgi:hypothetical protein
VTSAAVDNRLTPDEAAIVLIAIDVAREMGWDGQSPDHLESATRKLEQQAGDRQAEVLPLRKVVDA